MMKSTVSSLGRSLVTLLLLLPPAFAQGQTAPAATAPPSSGGISLAPARFHLEMSPGTEKTVVVTLTHGAADGAAKPSRIAARLSDWNLTREGQVEFYKAGSRPGSASPWIIYSPSEATVAAGQTHSIRVTISVPPDAQPGDHLAALIVEPRQDDLKTRLSGQQMLVTFRMATVFYITVPRATRRGALQNLKAELSPEGVVITPTIRNEGNSLIRPVASVRIVDSAGRAVFESPAAESLPVLAGTELSRPLLIAGSFKPGAYTVTYRVDFKDGRDVTEGVADLRIAEVAVAGR